MLAAALGLYYAAVVNHANWNRPQPVLDLGALPPASTEGQITRSEHPLCLELSALSASLGQPRTTLSGDALFNIFADMAGRASQPLLQDLAARPHLQSVITRAVSLFTDPIGCIRELNGGPDANLTTVVLTIHSTWPVRTEPPPPTPPAKLGKTNNRTYMCVCVCFFCVFFNYYYILTIPRHQLSRRFTLTVRSSTRAFQASFRTRSSETSCRSSKTTQGCARDGFRAQREPTRRRASFRCPSATQLAYHNCECFCVD
jgi:hypothetical protein